MKLISIIIPNWNGEKQLQKNLPLLFNVLAKFEGKSEVIIVDDASTDGSRKYLEKLQNSKTQKLKKHQASNKRSADWRRVIKLQTIFNNRKSWFC